MNFFLDSVTLTGLLLVTATTSSCFQSAPVDGDLGDGYKPSADGDVDTEIDENDNTDDDADEDSPLPEICKGPIHFPDPYLETTIRDTIKKTTDNIFYEDVKTISSISEHGCGIVDLTGIQCLTGLSEILIADCGVRDLSPLSHLPNLTRLSIFWNDISDLTPLSGLTQLTYLDISINNVSDISALSGLSRLSSLDLADNNISDIAPLSIVNSQGKLSFVSVRDNPLDCTDTATQNIIRELKHSGVETDSPCD